MLDDCVHLHWQKHGMTGLCAQRWICAVCGKTRSDNHTSLSNFELVERIANRSAKQFVRKGFVFDCDEAVDAGIVAGLQAIKDGEIKDGKASRGAYAYINREINRAAGISLDAQQRPDYGYMDGRLRGIIPKPPKNKNVRWRQKNRRLGKCVCCGGQTIPEKTLCKRCRNKRREQYQRRRERAMHQTGGAKRITKTVIEMCLGLTRDDLD